MRALLSLIVTFYLAGCAEIPQIPNLSAKSLREIPPKHRAIIAEIAADHRDLCYFKLGKNFAELGDKAFGDGFIIGENSLETLRISNWRRASILYQNFQCDGLNQWRATSGIKVFVLVQDQAFEAWVSAALFTKKQGNKTIIVFPQEFTPCPKGRWDEGCEVQVYWDSRRSKFTSLNGPMILTPYFGEFP